MNYRFLPAAENDLIESTDYYEHCQNGLGTDFSIEGNEILILAVMNLHRNPKRLKDRISV